MSDGRSGGTVRSLLPVLFAAGATAATGTIGVHQVAKDETARGDPPPCRRGERHPERASDADPNEPADDTGGSLKAIARLAAGEAAAIRDGIQGHYAARIAGARRSGLSREQIAAAVLTIKQEMQAALVAAAGKAASELTGRVTAAVAERRSKGRRPGRGRLRTAHS